MRKISGALFCSAALLVLLMLPGLVLLAGCSSSYVEPESVSFAVKSDLSEVGLQADDKLDLKATWDSGLKCGYKSVRKTIDESSAGMEVWTVSPFSINDTSGTISVTVTRANAVIASGTLLVDQYKDGETYCIFIEPAE